MSKFTEGQKVVCIDDNFPLWKTTEEDKSGIGKLAPIHPKKGEILIIDEILGEFLNFRQYNLPLLNQWFHERFFEPYDDLEISQEDIEFSKNYHLV